MKPSFVKDQSGGVLIIFTILLTTTLIVGLLSLVVDVGSLYAERRFVQNGADSAALAVAQNCAVQSNSNGNFCSNPTGPVNLAKEMANLSAPDNLTAATICGTVSAERNLALGECGTLDSSKFECKPLSPEYKDYVRVKTQTEGQNQNFIASIFASNSDQSRVSSSVKGCAQAAWGKANSAPTLLPFAIPVCEFNKPNIFDGIPKVLNEFATNNSTSTLCTFNDLEGFPREVAPLSGVTLIQNIGCPGVVEPKVLKVYKVDDGEISPTTSDSDPPANTVYRLTSLSELENSCESKTGGQNCTGNCAARRLHDQMVSLVGRQVFAPAIGEKGNSTGSSSKFHILTFFSYKFIGACLNGDVIGDLVSSCVNSQISLRLIYTRDIVPGVDIYIPKSTYTDFPSIGAMAVQLLA